MKLSWNIEYEADFKEGKGRLFKELANLQGFNKKILEETRYFFIFNVDCISDNSIEKSSNQRFLLAIFDKRLSLYSIGKVVVQNLCTINFPSKEYEVAILAAGKIIEIKNDKITNVSIAIGNEITYKNYILTMENGEEKNFYINDMNKTGTKIVKYTGPGIRLPIKVRR